MSIRFAIIIPFRPRSESNDWERESDLLRQTLFSLLQQTYKGIKVFVVYNEEPAGMVVDEQLQYVLFPHGHQVYDEIPAREELLVKFKYSKKMVVRRWDKARKLNYGCQLAKEQGFDYVMALDADDLLSKYFFAYLADRSDNGRCAGWCLEKGYVFKPPTRYLLRVPKGMRALNGSTNILRADLIKIPDFHSTDWNDYNQFTDHGTVKERLFKSHHVQLQIVQRPMLVYVVHGSNISKIDEKEYGFRFKAIVKRIIRFVPLTKRLRKEFGIASLNRR